MSPGIVSVTFYDYYCYMMMMMIIIIIIIIDTPVVTDTYIAKPVKLLLPPSDLEATYNKSDGTRVTYNGAMVS